MVIFCMFGICTLTKIRHEDLDAEKMTRRNMLLAMKKTQEDKMEGKIDADKEISPGEQHEMKSLQYKSVVKD